MSLDEVRARWPLTVGERVEIATYNAGKITWRPAKVVAARVEYATFKLEPEDGSCPSYGRNDEGRTWRRHFEHAPTCEADGAHDYDCATATELQRLRAFAEHVRDHFGCVGRDGPPCDEVGKCWHCAAVQALERAR